MKKRLDTGRSEELGPIIYHQPQTSMLIILAVCTLQYQRTRYPVFLSLSFISPCSISPGRGKDKRFVYALRLISGSSHTQIDFLPCL